MSNLLRAERGPGLAVVATSGEDGHPEADAGSYSRAVL